MDEIILYKSTNDIFDDACNIIENTQRVAYHSVNVVLVLRNWLLGRRISEEELNGEDRAKYGAEVIKKLSKSLSDKYGKGFSPRVLYKCQQFYRCFPGIVPTLSAQSEDNKIVPTLSAKILSWSHYENLIQIYDEEAREWYAKEAYDQTWSVRTLQRNIASQYYYRILKSQDKQSVKEEMIERNQMKKVRYKR